MSKCCDTQCESESRCCDSQPCGEQSCEQSCEGKCPVETMAGMWKGSFFQAMREAQVEILKTKIQKAWGPTMEQAADALLEAMGTVWQAKIAGVKAAEAECGFKEKLAELMTSAERKK